MDKTTADRLPTSPYFSGVVPVQPLDIAWNLYHGQVDLMRLDPERKRRAWAFIKANRPELHQMLEKDPLLKAIREKFQVQAIWIRVEDAGLENPIAAAS